MVDKKSRYEKGAMLKGGLTEVRKRCCETGRGRGVYGQYRLNRIKINEYVNKGEIVGLKKAVW